MTEQKNHSEPLQRIREQAERLLRQNQGRYPGEYPDIFELIHELHIHQTELELQNEELKRSQMEISALRQEYEELYEFAPCGYITLSGNKIITRANRTAVMLLRADKPFLYQTPFSQFIDGSFETTLRNSLKLAAESGEKQNIELLLNQRQSGRSWLMATIEADRDENDVLMQWRITLADISRNKKMEEELRQAQKMKAVGNLAGGIAHEINNMLAIIMGNAELLAEDQPQTSQATDILDDIQEASLRARDVVRKLLKFARKSPTSRREIQIGTVVRDAITQLSTTLPATIDIRSEILCDNDTIMADETEIRQIMINLCTNAVEAMPDWSGKLKISLAPVTVDAHHAERYDTIGPGDYVKLVVRDNGRGIPPESLENVFEPYFSTKDGDEGAGMGLAIVYGIVKSYGGAVRISSKVGSETSVEILLPQTTMNVDKRKRQDPDAVLTSFEHILFVDDEKQIVAMSRQILEKLGYRVTAVSHPLEALALFQNQPEIYDLVITDLTMPQMTGVSLSARLKEQRPDIPIILCSGYSSPIDKSTTKDAHIDGFLMKPFSKEEISHAIRAVLAKKSTAN